MSAAPPPSTTGIPKLDALKAQAPAVDPTRPQGLALYSRFAFAGAVCCSVTHGAFTPVDVYVFRAAATLRWVPMAAVGDMFSMPS